MTRWETFEAPVEKLADLLNCASDEGYTVRQMDWHPDRLRYIVIVCRQEADPPLEPILPGDAGRDKDWLAWG